VTTAGRGAEIHRSLSYVCSGQPYGGDYGCNLFFCGKNIGGFTHWCGHFCDGAKPFDLTPDRTELTRYRLTSAS